MEEIYDDGQIKLVNDDCLSALLDVDDNSVDMVFADLPYGYFKKTINWDNRIPFEPLWNQLLRVGRENCAFIFTATQPFTTDLILSQRKLFKYVLVWDKGRGNEPQMANRRPMKRHEDIIVFCRTQTIYNPQMEPLDKPYHKVTNASPNSLNGKGQNIMSGVTRWVPGEVRTYTHRYPTSIIQFPNPNGKNLKINPTQKPVALLEWLINTYTDEDMLVLDPTFGSATTALACIRTKRRFIGMEKDPEMFQLACRRLEDALFRRL